MNRVIVHVAANQICRDGTLCGSLINCAKLSDACRLGDFVETRIMWVDEGRVDVFGIPYEAINQFGGE